MGRPVDRDTSYMKSAFGTTRLVTDYQPCSNEARKSNSFDLAGSLRNSDDYDDWEYGTEPIPGDPTWTRKPSS